LVIFAPFYPLKDKIMLVFSLLTSVLATEAGLDDDVFGPGDIVRLSNDKAEVEKSFEDRTVNGFQLKLWRDEMNSMLGQTINITARIRCGNFTCYAIPHPEGFPVISPEDYLWEFYPDVLTLVERGEPVMYPVRPFSTSEIFQLVVGALAIVLVSGTIGLYIFARKSGTWNTMVRLRIDAFLAPKPAPKQPLMKIAEVPTRNHACTGPIGLE